MQKLLTLACAAAISTAACAGAAPPVVPCSSTTSAPAPPPPSASAPRPPFKVIPADTAGRLPPEERGAWEPASEDRWRAAIDGYRSAITLDKQRPLGDKALALATYMNEIHKRVHPWFADRFLAWVDKRPMGDPLADSRLVVRVELAVAPDGTLARMGVVKASGVPAFDASALEAFARAAPLPPTPAEIRSADGNLWLHWEMHRDEVRACSTMYARPFMLAP